MKRLSFSILAKACALATAVSAAPALAAPHYRAAPAAPPPAERLIVRDLMWRCGNGECTTGPSNSRPAVVCAALVRKVGTLRSFIVQGKEMGPRELQKCNARAR